MSRDIAQSALLSAILLASCVDDESAGVDAAANERDAALAAGAEGDWFVCADAACTELQTTGLRLTDHMVYHLRAAAPAGAPASHFMDGDPYCVTEPFGSYVHDGIVLTLTLHDGGLVVDTELALDDAGITAHGGDMHKVIENATGRWVDDECLPP
jgi:hypothetical protein